MVSFSSSFLIYHARNDRPSDSQDDIPPLSEVHTPSVKSTDNNKDNNKGDNNNINELNIHSLIKEYSVKDDHYQQIIDWAREDGRITPEGEEILKN